MDNRTRKVTELMKSFHTLIRAKGFRPPVIKNITPSQWDALMVLEARGKSNVKSVAEALRISSSAATQLVDGLVASGYLIRHEDPDDRRQMVLTISKKSTREIAKLKKQNAQKFLELFSVLSDKEFNQFILLHKRVAEKTLQKEKNI
ncbi:MAG TPA: MarR family transcriptional regulator [Candidatus Paceibacterota bacterium]|nr:MarR family transcriptional regulator [Candidatus Paceibacterota bacterium]HQI25980.1 MarR family transcriptional regulator [Candidatus Paceibacterota bacterium]